ncbi:fibronectin type III domain-containing protein [Priestia megaterium]
MDIRSILVDHGIEIRPNGAIEGNFDSLNQRITDLDQYISGAFSDGVIEQMEARKIQASINLLEEANKKTKERYDLLIDNTELSDSYTRDELIAAKINYDERYRTLLATISLAIADMKSTKEEANAVDEAFLNLNEASARLEKAMQLATDYIIGKRTNKAENNAKEYANAIKTEVLNTTDDLEKRIHAAEGYVDGSFRDGIITEFEAKNIRSYLDSLTLQKTQLDERYNEIYMSQFLSGTPKFNLQDAKTKYDKRHKELVDAIYQAIEDWKATPEEAAAVRQGFVELDTALSLLVQCFEKAIESLSQVRADQSENNAKDHADEKVDEIKNDLVYKVEITSSEGLAFKNGQFLTKLEAKVYHGATDVTADFDASRFRWKRVSDDKEGDERWNVSHAGGTKTIDITPGDIKVRATFNCMVYEDSSTDVTPPALVTNLRVKNLTRTSIEMQWNESSSDDVAAYDIKVGSTTVGSTVGLSFNITDLLPSTEYTILVFTRDMAGNLSTSGVSKIVTTLT